MLSLKYTTVIAIALMGTFGLLETLATSQVQDTRRAPKPHDGQPIYRDHCASCHDNAEVTRSPTFSTLQQMSPQTINYALTEGKMREQGSSLSSEERETLIDFLTEKTAATIDNWTNSMMCGADRKIVELKGEATVSTFGFDSRNTRALTSEQAGISKADLGRLELAWAIGFPGVTMMRSQAAVVGDNLFLPVAEAAAVYSFDISNPMEPCIQWIYKTPTGAPLRTSAAYGVIADGTPVVAFSGLDSTVYALHARTGKALWTKNVARYTYSLTTGTPRVLENQIIVPVSQYEILQGADNAVECCTSHGYIVSLDPKTGDQQWRYDTMEDAGPIRDRGDGKMLLGPSGAPIWNSPVVDEKRGLIYFGTGEATSPPAHRNTDALIAIRLKDGVEVWSHQALANDIYLGGCGRNPREDQLNCVGPDETVYLDYDFGASLILAKLSNGKEIIFAGQKSGTVWALEPDTGKVVWRRDIGTGATNGGIHWGIAFANDTVYVPISVLDMERPESEWPGWPPVDPSLKRGLYGVDALSGNIKWMYGVDPDCTGDREVRSPTCSFHYGMSGAPTFIDGAVISGGLDGRLYVVDAETGKEIWMYDTLRDFQTINGVPGKGGSIDSPSIIGTHGIILVNSGYGVFGQTAGNVLLAFRPKDK